MRPIRCAMFVIAIHAVTLFAAHGSSLGESAKHVTLEHCVVSLIAEAQIPAKKPGVILRYAVAEGATVQAGDEVAQIDVAEAQVQVTVAKRQLEAAQKQAENDIDVRYAKAAAEVAKAEVAAAHDANSRVPGTVPNSEVRRLQLARERAELGIEQAEFQYAAAKMETSVAEAQLDAAKLEVTSRRIVSPIDGFVVRLHRHEGEWVDAGQPLCHVVGLERLRVIGFINVDEHEQHNVLGRKVKVTVPRIGGKSDDFIGTIDFASPLVQPGGEYRVWAEVENRRRDGFWILRPGLATQMTITLD